MKATACLTAFVLAIAPATARPATTKPQTRPAARKTTATRYEWLDKARSRTVPVKIYLPAAGAGPFPVIVFSHGLGGSREGYEYLGSHWAAHGYVCVHLQHKGSDTDVWRGKSEPKQAMRRAAADLRNALHRPLDVRFALDELTRMNRGEGPLAARLDLERIGAAGHSFGAYTVLAVAGERFAARAGRTLSLADPRVKAALAMSAPVPRDARRHEAAFAAITIPCLHMTGTRDDSPIGHTAAAQRRIPFDHSRAANQFLLTLKGGDHMVFSGRRLRGRNTETDLRFHELIKRASLAFWDAYLKGDAKARKWLAEGGLDAALRSDGTFEKRLQPRKP